MQTDMAALAGDWVLWGMRSSWRLSRGKKKVLFHLYSTGHPRKLWILTVSQSTSCYICKKWNKFCAQQQLFSPKWKLHRILRILVCGCHISDSLMVWILTTLCWPCPTNVRIIKMPSQFMVSTAKPWVGDGAVAASARTSHCHGSREHLCRLRFCEHRLPTALLPAQASFLLRSQ